MRSREITRDNDISMDGVGLAQEVLASLPFLVFAVDSEMRLLYANRIESVERLLTDSPSGSERGLLGKSVTKLLPSRDRPVIEALVRKALSLNDGKASAGAASAPLKAEIIRETPNGFRPLLLLAMPLSHPKESNSVLLTCHDLTRPTGLVAPNQLDPEREAARLDTARQLAATLNHEINNPLFIVSATLEDVLADTEDPEMQRRLNGALDAVWRVASAVKQLQDIRQIVSTAYIEGFPMIDLEASSERR
jgi:signal transduction histidine kinase